MPATKAVYRFFLYNPDGSLSEKPYSIRYDKLMSTYVKVKFWKAVVPGRYFKIIRNGKTWIDSRDMYNAE